ncbi:bifunctional adenosylcobinamide kinase/adenosylcobinamide-phosphate guanylyltransferase [Pseudovibrio sp. FO-BEG1]|uniref:bifunctional adenosylcobinamide kinase/adenosylcobinamide-phosphate guanylyltransferase n=1 Tax=Pseudovibrio sp. (strain FO-BEG1) TaxID=911045 RepID=UPI000A058FA1|nr:bifunctional adenosylcobinamide kinase/adenosylcobinamide-phosphate guanylyltransferase [Pseudovibrio sp. FO-BEG1]
MAEQSGDLCVRHCLVTGGARSGKSVYAEKLVLSSGRRPTYIATGQAFDGEMEERIAHHKMQRGDLWDTVEEPLELVRVLKEHAHAECAILVDCLTLWLSNLMHAQRDWSVELEQLRAVLSDLPCPVVFVGNEVGMGIVPENAMARAFRDEAGRLNQRIAEFCHYVMFVAAGQPLQLKPAVFPEISL